MFRTAASIVSAAVVSVAIIGCASDNNTVAEGPATHTGTGYTGSSAAPTPRPVAAEPAAQSKTAAKDGRLHSSYAYPTGHEETSVLLLERDLPATIVSGQEFWYDIKVTNVNHSVAKAVVVRDECATQLTVISADPAPASEKTPLVWNIGDLKPGDSRTIHVVGKTASGDPFTSCASASYNNPVCLTAVVVKPALKLTLSAPTEATPCDAIPVRLLVTNTGTGAAREVHVAYPLPQGWTTADGKASAAFAIDALEPNQSKEFTINVNSPKTGEYSYKANATGAFGLKAESATATTVVRQAVLAVKAQAPEHVYAGRPVTLKFIVSNSGNTQATAATLESPLPAGVKFLSATDGGVLQSGVVAWKLDPIAVKGMRTVSMTVEPGAIGGIETIGTAKAYCAAPVSVPINMTVFGVPALLLEVIDLTDPIEVGGETTYQIVVTNQGSMAATNVKIVAALEANQQFVSVNGGKAVTAPDSISFEPIPSIAAKGAVTLKVTVKCIEVGDTRFKVTMTSDQLTRPVEESESTFIFR